MNIVAAPCSQWIACSPARNGRRARPLNRIVMHRREMTSLNKIEVAAEMFVEAHERFKAGNSDIDYVISIVLSGAVMGIVSPLLKEQGGHTSHSLLARISNLIAEPGEEPTHEGVFRATYNAFKHSGNDRRKIAPSADLVISTDLKREAAHMLDAAKDDFRQIEVDRDVIARLAPQFIELLDAEGGYA